MIKNLLFAALLILGLASTIVHAKNVRFGALDSIQDGDSLTFLWESIDSGWAKDGWGDELELVLRIQLAAYIENSEGPDELIATEDLGSLDFDLLADTDLVHVVNKRLSITGQDVLFAAEAIAHGDQAPAIVGSLRYEIRFVLEEHDVLGEPEVLTIEGISLSDLPKNQGVNFYDIGKKNKFLTDSTGAIAGVSSIYSKD